MTSYHLGVTGVVDLVPRADCVIRKIRGSFVFRNEDRNKVLPAALRFSERRESRRVLKTFWDSLEWDYQLNAQGLFIRAQHFNVEMYRPDSFARRVVKALFYREKGYRLPDDHRVNPMHHSRLLTFQSEEGPIVEWFVSMLYDVQPRAWGKIHLVTDGCNHLTARRGLGG